MVSDCGGVSDIGGYEHTNASETAAIGLRDGGVDINCGGGLTNHICDAISEGLVEESVLDASLERSISLLLDAGMFDPLEGQEYTQIGFDAIGSTYARELALDASRQAQVRSAAHYQRTARRRQPESTLHLNHVLLPSSQHLRVFVCHARV